MAVLSVAEAREHLVLTSSPATDSALQAIIEAAEAAIVARCGYLEPTPVTETVSACRGPLFLKAPLISVESVTLDDAAQTVDTLTGMDLAAGIIPGSWSGTFVVSYTAGRTEVRPDLMMGVKELVAHLWATTQRSAADRRGREAPAQQPGGSYVFPHRVEQWIAPYVQVGIA